MSNPASVESRLRGALWGFFAGDALAMPTHWYYGGLPQITRDYGRNGITGYSKPVPNLSGSILNKSNINGGGRGSFSKTNEGISIIGDVINHGKREYWDPSKQVHYHATLQQGENTLEAQLARVLMKSMVANDGKFNADHFRDAYVKFMTTPDSHHDTYASTCHRMFFANLVLKKKDAKDCPDNDHHNVDTIDGLVLPTISALGYASSGNDDESVANAAALTASVTRASTVLEKASSSWGSLVRKAIQQDSLLDIDDLTHCARSFGLRQMPSATRPDTMSACYLEQSLPSALDMIAKYSQPPSSCWEGLLANANNGGENVHRGSILGAVLGAQAGEENLPDQLKEGLHDRAALEQEIDAFVKSVLPRNSSFK
eukprot:CAMPEP_0178908454 /NCGR_PEP_ID=MMETSP0786-20121207/7933_1 /TAXON_ID=186022 /ORGANISM="Thalassionema frauenfeldii, Strain CCMP 1798" /LENGTH=371 /DNA_ID=CAMNT_0020580361 /DNA_START=212 /DNA_END=1327 /DNA_ORIENTATION=+